MDITEVSLSFGHVYGASVARMLVALRHSMERDNVNKDLAAECIGSSMSVAIAIERVH